MNNKHKLKNITKKLTSIIISIIFFAEGMMFYNHYSYAHHINQAKGELIYLQSLLDGDKKIGKGLKASVLEAFNVEINENENDIKLKNLSKKIVDSTEQAIEIADDMKRVVKLKKAIDEINDFQTNSISIIENAIQKIEDESVNEKAKAVYDTAIDLKEKVNHAKKEIQTAIDNNQKKIEINIHTKLDKHHHGEIDKDESDDHKNTKQTANDIRIEKNKKEDAIQRNANIERIKIIEKGNSADKAAKKSRELEKRMEKAQRERAKR